MLRSQLLYTVFLASVPFSVVSAQTIPDRSLGTTQQQSGSEVLVKGGTQRGNNLFQSFERFNIPSGTTVTFVSPDGVERIVTRVTGSDASQIDGGLAVAGAADFFLVNPNGIFFGPDARLQLSGSFLGTTATTVNFADGTSFTVADPQPLLSVSAPVGLGLSGYGEIHLSGNGHNLALTPFDPFNLFTLTPQTLNAGQSETGLRVAQGQSFSLIAGNLNLDGAVILAPEGRINLIAAQEGHVSLGSVFDNTHIGVLGDITLQNLALLDTSGRIDGRVSISTGTLSLVSGSHILNRAETGGGGEISIRADESITISGVPGPDPVLIEPEQALRIISSVFVESFGGSNASISVKAPSVKLLGGGGIASISFEAALGSVVEVEAREILLSGTSIAVPTVNLSNILVGAAGTGRGSDIRITADSIEVLEGAAIASGSLLASTSGNIEIEAETILVEGITSFAGAFELGSRISSQNGDTDTSTTTGAGDVNITTRSLQVLRGGTINTNTSSINNAGAVQINADEVLVDGSSGNMSLQSNISSASTFIIPLPGIEDRILGNGGDINVNADLVSLSNGGFIGVSNIGQGRGGSVMLTVSQISLDGSSIAAESVSDIGGEIILESSILLLENGSAISANSVSGDGGIVNINSAIISVDEASQITAESLSGDGQPGIINLEVNFRNSVEFEAPTFIDSDELSQFPPFCMTEERQRFTRRIGPDSGLQDAGVAFIEADRFDFDETGGVRLVAEGSEIIQVSFCRPGVKAASLSRLPTVTEPLQ